MANPEENRRIRERVAMDGLWAAFDTMLAVEQKLGLQVALEFVAKTKRGVCTQCGGCVIYGPYPAHKAHAKYCTATCRRKAWKERHKVLKPA